MCTNVFAIASNLMLLELQHGTYANFITNQKLLLHFTPRITYQLKYYQGYFCDEARRNAVPKVPSQDTSWNGIPDLLFSDTDITNTTPSSKRILSHSLRPGTCFKEK
jgi:hypothetical protein